MSDEPEVPAAPNPTANMPWDEQWFHGLEAASQRWFANKDFEGMKEILEPLHDKIEQVNALTTRRALSPN